ncbi:MAG: alpha/beta hydrolase [Hyphomicrobiaceae bacterium]
MRTSENTPRASTGDVDGAAHGQGPGVLVMLHAAGSGPHQLDALARLLVPAVGSTVAPVLDGGTGPLGGKRENPFSGGVRLVDRLLDKNGGGRRLLFGHSMGGLVATLALASGSQVDAAVLYEPIVLSLLDDNDDDDRRALDWDRAVIATLHQRMAEGDAAGGVKHFIESYGQVRWEALPAAARDVLVAQAPNLLATALATHAQGLDPAALMAIPAPVLIISGSRSPDVTRRMADRLAECLVHGERVEIDGLGHMGAVAAPQRVHDCILAFLTRLGLS